MTDELKKLWKQGFGDEDADIDAFFETVYDPEAAAVICEDGKPVSAMYLIEGIILPVNLNPRQTESDAPGGFNVTYLYALATRPDCRGRGLGAKTVRAAADLAFSRGADIVALTPADSGLERWYRKVGFPYESRAAGIFPIFPEKYLKLFEIYNGNRDVYRLSAGSTEVLDHVIYETGDGKEVPGFAWGAMLG